MHHPIMARVGQNEWAAECFVVKAAKSRDWMVVVEDQTRRQSQGFGPLLTEDGATTQFIAVDGLYKGDKCK